MHRAGGPQRPLRTFAAKRFVTPRERRLYKALGLILGVNLLVLFGVLTFFTLAFHK